MFSEYFVLITDDCFGVFPLSAVSYPEEFKENINCVTVVKANVLDNYLIEKLGRNILINKEFDVYNCLGNLYSRTPN